jgi:COP9 signalosome complex subunit 1
MSSAAASSLDLDTYIANYSGHTRLKRLQFIASHEPALRTQALQMAVDLAKQGINTSLYLELCARSACPVPRDDAWVEAVDKKASATLEKLEAELTSHKTSLIKESIRLGHNELGNFHRSRGDFATALKCYVRARDYCTTSKHTISMCLNVIQVSIHMCNYAHVSNYVSKAESMPDISDPVLFAQLRVAAGLTALDAKKYRAAARHFVDVTVDLGSAFSEVCSMADVALYGGLCALAAFDRAELSAKVVSNTAFRSMLELYPEVRELVNDFHSTRYASCLGYLAKLKPLLLVDVYLRPHVSQLYANIRSKALVQYFSPYVSVDMRRMATAFNVAVVELEKELAALIMAGAIPARIDSQSKVLYARHADQRHATFEKALAMGEAYMRNTKALLLRINLLRADFAVKGSGDTFGPSKSSRQDRQEGSNVNIGYAGGGL